MQRWRDAMRAQSRAPKTLNRRISSLSSFYKYLAAAAEFRLPINVGEIPCAPVNSAAHVRYGSMERLLMGPQMSQADASAKGRHPWHVAFGDP